MDRHGAGLVVERDVAAGDGDLEFEAPVGEALDGLRELPHDLGVLRAAEVQAVRHSGGHGTGHGDVAVRLGECQAGALLRIELAVPAVGVGRDGEAESALFVDADHAAVVGEAQRRVAEHVGVVLIGDPALVRQVRRAEQFEELLAQHAVAGGAGSTDAESACRASIQVGYATGRS